MIRVISVLAGTAIVASGALAQLGSAISDHDKIVLQGFAMPAGQSYDNQAMLTSWEPGDMFGITSRSTAPATLPDAITDDTNGAFPADTLGLIDAGDQARFFGVVDTWNAANGNAGGLAQWAFDLRRATGSSLSISIDFAAMGDFETANDIHRFEYSFDGHSYSPLFTSSINEAGSQSYTLASGGVVTLDDPMRINGVTLNNRFQTVSTTVSGTGTLFYIIYRGESDGGSEAFAFRNITVIPAPGAGCVAMALLVVGRRRRD